MFPVQALAEVPDARAAQTHVRSLDKIERQLKKSNVSSQQLAEMHVTVLDISEHSQSCVTALEDQIPKVAKDLDSLGKYKTGEAGDVTRKRSSLKQEKDRQEKLLASCKVLSLRTSDLLADISKSSKAIIAEHLLARGQDFFTLISNNWLHSAEWVNKTLEFVTHNSGLAQVKTSAAILIGWILLVVVVLTLLLKSRFRSWSTSHNWQVSYIARVTRAFGSSLFRYLPYLVTGLSLVVFFYIYFYDAKDYPFIAKLVVGLPVYFFVLLVIDAIFSPPDKQAFFLNIPVDISFSISRRLKSVMTLLLVGYVFFATLLSQSLPDVAILIARGVFATLLMINLIWAFWLLSRIPLFVRIRWFPVLVNVWLVLILLAEWSGYRNLSVYTVRAVFGSVVILGTTLILSALLRELINGLEQGQNNWHRVVRRFIGVKTNENVPGILWVRLSISIVLWVVFVFLILQIWGLSDASTEILQGYLISGFELGSLKIVPARILLAIIAFSLFLWASRWFKRQLEKEWLARSRMERGAREALITVSGYLGATIAMLLGLGVAGVEFSNFAIIAGALSVGIGFGLQNIVNNFISGLILLFERPVKTGDWIVVGNTEGYVKKISIRSTQIQTFDRADVIVPNSELISTQVTNWMLYDTRGRIRIPVGVAYGSDTEKVKEILLEIAEQHPAIISDSKVAEPKVLFRRFGDSALEFELRGFIRNIDERMNVISDVNFAIEKAFREQGIEIPFPQQDIHIRDWSKPEGS